MIHSLWVINKAGGLVYQSDYAPGLAKLSSNEYLVMAGTLHGIHAITSRISPVPRSSGVQTIEAETFKLSVLLSQTGIKFVLLSSINHPNPESTLQKIYEAYSDAVMKNPFYTLEMPINASGFDARVAALISATAG